jgi:iron(III) transport system permease protein
LRQKGSAIERGRGDPIEQEQHPTSLEREEMRVTVEAVRQTDVPARLPERQGSGVAVQGVIAALLVVLIAVPLAPMLIQAFLDKPIYYPDASFTLGNFTRFATDPEIRGTLVATGLFCTIVVVFSMTVGTGLAILVGRTDMPFRGLALAVLLWPLFISPQIIGFGAILAYGPVGFMTSLASKLFGPTPWTLYSITGIAIVVGVASTPLTILYCLSAARQQDPNHSAAARVVGAGPARILSRINLPLMRPALVFALIMNIVHALETLAIPLLLGQPVGIKLLTTLIYDKSFARGTPDYGLVAALAILLMLVVGLLFAVQRLLLTREHRFVSIGSRTAQMTPLALGRWRWPACALVMIYIALGTLVILGAVGVRSVTLVMSPLVSPLDVLTLRNYQDIFAVDVYVRSILNTLVLALIGAALGTALIAAVSLVAQRSASRFRRPVDMLAQLPRVIPGILVGLGVFYALVFVPGLNLLSGTIWALLIAYLIRFLSSGYGIVSPALLQISTDFDRAARSVGAGWTTTMRRIVIPLTKPALMSCFVLLMILIIKEYASAIFLMKPGSEVIGSTMLSLWLQGQTGPVAALAMLQIGATALLIVVATRTFGVKLHG